MPIPIAPGVTLHESDIEEHFVRASGPGGQNVNKVSSAVQLRFNLWRARGIPDDVKRRAAKLAGSKFTLEGDILIHAQRFRMQETNRRDALHRLCTLLQKAANPPPKRTPTRPTRASKTRRAESKKRRSVLKSTRAKKIAEE